MLPHDTYHKELEPLMIRAGQNTAYWAFPRLEQMHMVATLWSTVHKVHLLAQCMAVTEPVLFAQTTLKDDAHIKDVQIDVAKIESRADRASSHIDAPLPSRITIDNGRVHNFESATMVRLMEGTSVKTDLGSISLYKGEADGHGFCYLALSFNGPLCCRKNQKTSAINYLLTQARWARNDFADYTKRCWTILPGQDWASSVHTSVAHLLEAIADTVVEGYHIP